MDRIGLIAHALGRVGATSMRAGWAAGGTTALRASRPTTPCAAGAGLPLAVLVTAGQRHNRKAFEGSVVSVRVK